MGDGAAKAPRKPAAPFGKAPARVIVGGDEDLPRSNAKKRRGTRKQRRPMIRSCALAALLAWFGLVLVLYLTAVSHHEKVGAPSRRQEELHRHDGASPHHTRRGAIVALVNATNQRPKKNAVLGDETEKHRRDEDSIVRFEGIESNGRGGEQTHGEKVGKGGADPRTKRLPLPGALPKCEANKGPDDENVLREMVYWRTLPSDYPYLSPHLRDANLTSPSKSEPRKYLHFELDDCGFNNNRIVFETALVLAHAMGRTLIIPPRRKMYGMDDDNEAVKPMGYYEYFPLEELNRLRSGIDFISTEDFLKTEVVTGNLRDLKSGRRVYPPGGLTDWDGARYHPFRGLIRSISVQPRGWDPEECLVVFCARPNDAGAAGEHREMMRRAMARHPRPVVPALYRGKPTPADASPEDRFREAISERKKTCLYTEELVEARVLNFPVTPTYRIMMHFYAATYFEDWRADLWYKRLIRDGVRFRDEIVCAAARIVEALRSRARERDNAAGEFDAFHVRRTDFLELYEGMANETGRMVFDTSKGWILPDRKRVVYVATDERNRTFFEPLEGAYDVRYLDDYVHLLEGVRSNIYPMIEMMVVARSKTFVGMYWSTFTGYINRLRGYYSQSEKLAGYESGELRHSHHYNSVTAVQKNEYLVYKAVKRPAWYREFPVGWRDIDRSVGRMG